GEVGSEHSVAPLFHALPSPANGATLNPDQAFETPAAQQESMTLCHASTFPRVRHGKPLPVTRGPCGLATVCLFLARRPATKPALFSAPATPTRWRSTSSAKSRTR